MRKEESGIGGWAPFLLPSELPSAKRKNNTVPVPWGSYGDDDDDEEEDAVLDDDQATVGGAILKAPPTRMTPSIPLLSPRNEQTTKWGELIAFDDRVEPDKKRWGVASAVCDYEDAQGDITICVHFLDGTSVDQAVDSGSLAFEILRSITLRLGVEPRESGALALYEQRENRLSRVVAPSERVDDLVDSVIVLAVRLLTAPVHASAMRGAAVPQANNAIARLLYAQTVAAVMTGSYAVLPRVHFEHDHEDPRRVRDTDQETWRDAYASTDPRSAGARLRLGAWRLWSRALDVVGESEDLESVAERLVDKFGASTFCPVPACTDDDLIAEFLAVVGEDDEFEHVQGSSLTQAIATCPEAKYLELCARSPAYGATLFACTRAERKFSGSDETSAGSPSGDSASTTTTRWLALSRRGASILTADASARLHDIPMECARRWCRRNDNSLCLESERPPNLWPLSAARRRQTSCENLMEDHADDDDSGGLLSYFSSSSPKKKKQQQVLRTQSQEILAGRLDDKESSLAPVNRIRFTLDINPNRAAAGGADEAVSLLDDYCICDMTETPPTFGWEEFGRDTSSTTLPEENISAKPRAMPGFYDALVAAVVRPPRFHYETRLLGPSSFKFGGRRYHRHDLVLANRMGHRIHVSHWREAAFSSSSPDDLRPCVVFTHANSASRAQCCHYLSLVLSLGCSFAAFDCSGSGLSDGSMVSLGWREAHDLRVVLECLRKSGGVSSLAVWGQSMGAAAAIYYQGLSSLDEGVETEYDEEVDEERRWPVIDAVVLDSPYSDFQQLATHIAGGGKKAFGGFSLPTVILDLLLSSLDASVKKKAGFSPIQNLSPIKHAPHCRVPALFIRAKKDPLITQEHIEDLANRYAGTRTLALVEGNHSSPRDLDTRKFIGEFLEKGLPLPPEDKRPPRRQVARHLAYAPWQKVRAPQPNGQKRKSARRSSSKAATTPNGKNKISVELHLAPS